MGVIRPKTVDVEIIGVKVSRDKASTVQAEQDFPFEAKMLTSGTLKKGKPWYSLWKNTDGTFMAVPLDRYEQATSSQEELLSRNTATAEQAYHLSQKYTWKRRYRAKKNGLEKLQAGLYVALAGGLCFLLFVMFSEMSKQGG